MWTFNVDVRIRSVCNLNGPTDLVALGTSNWDVKMTD